MISKIIIKLIIILFIISNLLTFINSYKLERLNETTDEWELIEHTENVYKPIIVDRRELLYFRIERQGNTDTTSSTESLSIKFEIKSKDIQESFYFYGLNNETSIKVNEKHDDHMDTTPIRIENCLHPSKPLYFTLSMFNYLWGGDLLFTIEENDSNLCINSLQTDK